MTWASKRQASIIFVLLVLATIPIIYLVYQYLSIPPTCFDKKQNQSEIGIDCGGPCSLLCKSEILNPVVSWKRFFLVGSGVYNILVYVENPNVNAGAKNVGYEIRAFNTDGISMYERHGETTIPSKRAVPIVEAGISFGGQIPSRIEFKFDDGIVWYKEAVKEVPLLVSNSLLTKATSSPKLEANIKNNDSISHSDVEVVAILYDEKGNALGVSRTYIDKIESSQTQNLIFTWPEPFKSVPTKIEIIPKLFI